MKTPKPGARGTLREKEAWARLVNQKWDSQPVLSAEESARAAKRLYRFIMKRPWAGKVEVVSGNRYTWIRRGVLYVNPDRREWTARGLRALIHSLSHYCHRQLHPRDAPHSSRQLYIERDMCDYAIKYGFADGALKPKRRA